MDSLSRSAAVQRVLAKGVTRCSLLHDSGVQIDVRAVAPATLGAASLHFTGSRAHNGAQRLGQRLLPFDGSLQKAQLKLVRDLIVAARHRCGLINRKTKHQVPT